MSHSVTLFSRPSSSDLPHSSASRPIQNPKVEGNNDVFVTCLRRQIQATYQPKPKSSRDGASAFSEQLVLRIELPSTPGAVAVLFMCLISLAAAVRLLLLTECISFFAWAFTVFLLSFLISCLL